MSRIDTQRLINARIRKGWSQTDLATLIRVCSATICNVEAGRHANPKTVKKMADALGLKMDAIVIDDCEQVSA